MTKLTKDQKAFKKAFEEAEKRIMEKIRLRALELAKDEKLRLQMESDIRGELCQTETISREEPKSINSLRKRKKRAL